METPPKPKDKAARVACRTTTLLIAGLGILTTPINLCSQTTKGTEGTKGTPETPQLTLLGYAMVGDSPYGTFYNPQTDQRYFLSNTPNAEGNHIVEFHKGDSLFSTYGTAKIKNHTLAFTGRPPDLQENNEEAEEANPTEITYSRPYTRAEEPTFIGLEDGRRSAKQTLARIKTSKNSRNLILHYQSHPQPPNPTPETEAGTYVVWKGTKVPLMGEINIMYESDRELDEYYRAYQKGWESAFTELNKKTPKE